MRCPKGFGPMESHANPGSRGERGGREFNSGCLQKIPSVVWVENLQFRLSDYCLRIQATYGGGSASICGAGVGRSSLNGESVNKWKINKLINKK